MILEGEPTFVIRGRDALAVAAVMAYRNLCLDTGLHHQADEVNSAAREIEDWQQENQDLVHLPDHDHVDTRHLAENTHSDTCGLRKHPCSSCEGLADRVTDLERLSAAMYHSVQFRG